MKADDARRFFAEEIRVAAGVRSPRVIDALATTPRERFLGPGPWLVRGVYDAGGPRSTDDADPRHLYHDMAVAIDPSRNLYNGQPSLIARWIDQLDVAPGEQVLHIGCGPGYFTAILAKVVGPTGRVIAIDVDAALADRARENLSDMPWVTVSAGNGRTGLPSSVDVVLVHAGGTHILEAWLDALRDGGRLLLPLTMAVPGMPASIGKGFVVEVRRHGEEWTVKGQGVVAIYSLEELRDETAGAGLGRALMSGAFMQPMRLRRDPHDPGERCLAHASGACVSRA